jgi:hypothetical protein
VADRGGFDLLPEFGYRPVNKYLPPRARRDAASASIPAANAAAAGAGADSNASQPSRPHEESAAERLFTWIDQMLSR